LKNIDLNKQQSMYLTYMERDNSIWYDKKAWLHLLYSKVNGLEEEGLKSSLHIPPIIDRIFNTNNQKKLSQTDTEILLTNMYVLRKESVPCH
jgi:hypothetical protein